MRGEAGDGVDLVEDDAALGGEEHIHARHHAAAEGAVNLRGGGLDALLGLGADAGGHMYLRGLEAVLLDIVEDVAVNLYLVDAAYRQGLVAHDGAADLEAAYGLLDNDLAVEPEGELHGVYERGGVGDLGYAEARAGAHGLHEDGEADFPGAARELGLVRHGGEDGGLRHVDAGEGGETVRAVLVHADGARERAAAYDGYAGHLAQALYRAVLAVLAVHYGEGGVDARGLHAVRTELDYAVRLAVGGNHGGDAYALAPGVVLDALGPAVVAEPLAALGDAEQYEVVFLPVEVHDDGVRRLQRNGILRRAAAEYNRDSSLFHLKASLAVYP